MQVTICDRCGKEIKQVRILGNLGIVEYSLSQHLMRYGWSTKNYQLCYNCHKAVKQFIEGAKDETK